MGFVPLTTPTPPKLPLNRALLAPYPGRFKEGTLGAGHPTGAGGSSQGLGSLP